MIRRRLVMFMLGVGPLACGGAGSPTGAPGEDRVGPVDLTQAPATLAMTCDVGTAPVFEMPCRIGFALAGGDLNAAGVHATECRLAQPDRPLAWLFLFPLADVRADPSTALAAPARLPSVSAGQQAIILRDEQATMSSVTGDLTFSRVDPTARAFVGAFRGTIVWTGTSGARTSCQIDGPLWGAPGDFL